jgi:hypothetical protein
VVETVARRAAPRRIDQAVANQLGFGASARGLATLAGLYFTLEVRAPRQAASARKNSRSFLRSSSVAVF